MDLQTFNGSYAFDIQVTAQLSSGRFTLTTGSEDQNAQENHKVVCDVANTTKTTLEFTKFDKFKTIELAGDTLAVLEGQILFTLISLSGGVHHVAVNPVYCFPVVNGEPDVDLLEAQQEIKRVWQQAFDNLQEQAVEHSIISTNTADMPTKSTTATNGNKLTVKELLEVMPTKLLVGLSVVGGSLVTLCVILLAQAFLNTANAKLEHQQTPVAAQQMATSESETSGINAQQMVDASADATLQMLKQMGVDPTKPAQDLGCLTNAH